MTVEPPAEVDPMEITADEQSPQVDLPFGIMEAISAYLEERPTGAVKRDLESAFKGKAERKRLAINELVRLGYVDQVKVGVAHHLTLREPYYKEYGDCAAGTIEDTDAA